MNDDDKFLLALGKKIEKLADGFDTQVKFAEKCGVDARSIRRIYKAQQNPSILVLRNIAKALDMELHELVNLDSEE